jgi:Putative peptidoglycan binding domain/L,D-transpeptidase catalytic domain
VGEDLDRGKQYRKSAEQRRREAALSLATVAIFGITGAVALIASRTDSQLVASAQSESAIAARDAAATADQLTDGDAVDLGGVELAELADLDPESASAAATQPGRADGGCTIGAVSLRVGADGDGVVCLQISLRDTGYYTGTADGSFGQTTFDAVSKYQEAEDFFVDGIVGRETAIGLSIWPDEESLVTRTPPPEPGATDLWDVELSPVASAGDDAPPLPENSGSGYRVVYDRAGQRVWAVDGDERIIRSWLVSGSTYGNETPGTHTVYSRSEVSTAWNGKAYLPLMIRYLKTERGNIGFHGIPTKVATGEVYQTTEELGTRLSGGCQRQHNTDAAFLWGFADVGTTVVVT